MAYMKLATGSASSSAGEKKKAPAKEYKNVSTMYIYTCPLCKREFIRSAKIRTGDVAPYAFEDEGFPLPRRERIESRYFDAPWDCWRNNKIIHIRNVHCWYMHKTSGCMGTMVVESQLELDD